MNEAKNTSYKISLNIKIFILSLGIIFTVLSSIFIILTFANYRITEEINTYFVFGFFAAAFIGVPLFLKGLGWLPEILGKKPSEPDKLK